VGIWTYTCTGVIISHCAAYSNKGSVNDGDGFDFDGDSINCTLEYSIAYNNFGSGILLDGYTGSGTWSGHVIRYNIFWGNGTNTGAAYPDIFMTSVSGAANCSIYGNTVVTTHTSVASITTAGTGNTVTNNIFYKSVSGTVVNNGGTTTWSNNCYYSPAGSVTHPTDAGAVTTNPSLVTPGTSPTVTNPYIITGAAGMKLQAGSPCLTAGATITDGGIDYFGTTTTVPLSIGAYHP
jgi:hypothetical protein